MLDAQTAARIAAFEAGRGRVRLPSALAALGGFAVALGIVAIVSANWDAIPLEVKLGLHGALNVVLGLLAWHWLKPGPGGNRAEVALLLLSASTLAFIAHVGQGFQLQGSALGLVSFWLALVTPFTLAFVRGQFHRVLWACGVVVWLYLLLDRYQAWLDARMLSGLALMVPVAAFYGLRGAAPSLDPGWVRLFRDGALSALAVMASIFLAHGHFVFQSPRADLLTEKAILGVGGSLLLLTAHFALAEGRRREARPLGFLLGSVPVGIVLPTFLPAVPQTLSTALLFCAGWVTVAVLALRHHEPGLFKLAVALVALRVFGVFLEAAGGLMATGFGLVLAGALLMGLGVAARKVIAWGGPRAAGA
ncbi:DUF2157 domain-containing protein [Aerophototrophica crusticola]|uniref:DUF2157 domain-containing protein n=1 Tax=Aerophototrophica crusticola TaxID=1709002 RepID=A0A858RBY4_9PROT|nr:DUF2157 domain-containing protein [Rhodospirillaceae bacterium B3]